MVSTIVNNNTARISIRKALTYSGCSKNMSTTVHKDHRYDITAAMQLLQQLQQHHHHQQQQ